MVTLAGKVDGRCRQGGSAQRAALRKHLVLILAFGAEVGWLMADPQLGAGEGCLQDSRGPHVAREPAYGWVARAGSRSYWFSAYLYSTATF